MDRRSRTDRVHWALTGLFMVLAVSEIVIRSACLESSSIIPWAWALGYILAASLPLAMKRELSERKESVIGTAILLLALGASLIPLGVESMALPLEERAAHFLNSLWQAAGYLMGLVPLLPEELQKIGIHWICCFSALVFLWIRKWKMRNRVLGIVMIFGCIRWCQYVPEIDGALFRLILAWCFSAAMEGSPGGAVPAGGTPYSGRLMASLLLTVGIFAGSAGLSALFPLDALNRWVGGWVPTQDVFRNEYTKYGQSGFLLENTEWYPLGKRLGGAVTLDKTPVMQVRASRPGLYLRGMVKKTYTGQAWESESLVLTAVTDQKELKGTKPFVLTIHPFNNRELTVFAPLHTDKVEAEGRKIQAAPEALYRLGFKWFPDKQSSYRVEGFLEVPETNPPPRLEPYLQLPEISSVLKEKSLEISGNGTAAEKMDRLTGWLRSNGTYRLDVAEPDAQREFVEQFVLGNREGYCTYFATALAVMGRASGVPTRYVEGYLLPSQTSGRQTYTITSDRAHAWVEAYIAGKGWVVYEPTPTFGSSEAAAGQQRSVEDAAAKPKSGAGKDQNAEKPAGIKSKRIPAFLGAIAIGVLALAAIRVLWVERRWKSGSTGPDAALWKLYAALSALTLLLPEIKSLNTPGEKLRIAKMNLPFRAFASHDIIKDTNRLLYGRRDPESDGFQALLIEGWQEYRRKRGILKYLYSRYGSLTLFNSYDSLIRHRHFRKDAYHGADQPHTSPQS